MYVPRVPGNAADGMPARNVQARDVSLRLLYSEPRAFASAMPDMRSL